MRRLFQVFNDDDRVAAGALIADDYRFTSPMDNGIDKASFFARCWPGDHGMTDFSIDRMLAGGDTVATTFEAKTKDGVRIRTAGVNRVRNGQIFEAEAYFGWSLPHRAAPGGFVDPS